MLRSATCLSALLACIALTGPSYAAEILVSDNFGQIADVNTATGAVTNLTTVTGTGGEYLTDVAYTSNGTLYGTTFAQLYSISGGAATAIGGGYGGLIGMNGLTGNGTGLLGAAYNTTSIYTISTSTGLTSGSSYSSGGNVSAGDLAFAGGILYEAVANPTNGNDELVNASTGAVIGYFNVGGSQFFSNFYGLAFDPTTDTMYGVAGTQVYTVGLSTGDLTADGNWSTSSLGSAQGAAIAPTPLPAALPLFATGLGALGLLGWRRKRKNAAAIATA